MVGKDFKATEAGKEAEQTAALFLKRRGYTILKQNYHTRRGEIDLICRDRDFLVFVEVKSSTRESRRFIGERVNSIKQRKIILAAREFLSKYEVPSGGCRFDVILMERTERDEWKIQHIKDAFRPDESNESTL